MNLLANTKITRVIDWTTGATTDVESSVIDTQGYHATTFLVGFGEITGSAVTSVKVQQSSDSDGSPDAFSDLEGTAIDVADDDDNKVVCIEIVEPTKRYLKVVVDRGTQNAVIDFGLAIQTGPSVMPTVHDSATVLATEIHASPSEGTA